MSSDEKLIKACIAGKKRAQRAFYNTFAPKMFAVSLRYMADKEKAEDVLQDSFIKIFRNLKNFRSEGMLEAWIRRIVVNTAISQIKKDKKWIFEDQEDFEDSVLETDENVYMPDADTVLSLFEQLPPGYRTVLNLYAVDDYSHKRIADELKISVNTSKSQLRKARRMLRKLIDSLEEVE